MDAPGSSAADMVCNHELVAFELGGENVSYKCEQCGVRLELHTISPIKKEADGASRQETDGASRQEKYGASRREAGGASRREAGEMEISYQIKKEAEADGASRREADEMEISFQIKKEVEADGASGRESGTGGASRREADTGGASRQEADEMEIRCHIKKEADEVLRSCRPDQSPTNLSEKEPSLIHPRAHIGANTNLVKVCVNSIHDSSDIEISNHSGSAEHRVLISYAKNVCKQCNQTFRTKDELIAHFQAHVKEKHRCKQCGVGYLTSASLNNHVKEAHKSQKIHQCEYCPASFSLKDTFLLHQRTHFPGEVTLIGKNRFRLSSPEPTKKTTQQRTKHKHKCTFCCEEFSSVVRLREHLRSPPDDGHFFCERCGKVFSLHIRWKDHAAAVSRGESCESINGRFRCDFCSAKFDTSRELSDHLRRPPSDDHFHCSLCMRHFSKHSTWKRHTRSCRTIAAAKRTGCMSEELNSNDIGVSDDTPLLAEVCKHPVSEIPATVGFFHRDESSHATVLPAKRTKKKRKHAVLGADKDTLAKKPANAVIDRPTEVTPTKKSVQSKLYGCKQCTLIYPTEAEFISHCKDHMKKVNVCEGCREGFLSVQAVRYHRTVCKSYAVVKPHQCHQCSARFSLNETLLLHQTLHLPDTGNYTRNAKTPTVIQILKRTCEFCSVQFDTAKDLNTHLRNASDSEHLRCTKCNKSFSDYSECKSHRDAVSSGKKCELIIAQYDCDFCSESFDSCDELKAHLRNPPSTDHFQCSLCLRTFSSHSVWKRHTADKYRCQLMEPKNKCAFCSVGFHTLSELKDHLRNPPDDDHFQCAQCDKTFSEHSAWKRHTISKERDCQMVVGTFNCHFCTATFGIFNDLIAHLRDPPDVEHFWCTACNKSFSKHAAWRKHVHATSIIGKSCESIHHCEFCMAVFETAVELDSHLNNPPDGSHFKCTLCGVSFSKFRTWKRHANSVSKGQACASVSDEHACEFCQVVFDTDGDLHAHLESPPGGHYFECKLCRKSFPTHSSWKLHAYAVSRGEACETIVGEHECTFCPCKFDTFEDLTAHLQRPPDEQHFKCDSCPKTFSKHAAWKLHMNSVSKGKSCQSIIDYKCTFCSAEFFSSAKLREHLTILTKGSHFRCDGCQKPLSSFKAWKMHTGGVFRGRDGAIIAADRLKCEFCGAAFCTEANLDAHLDSPGGENHFKCTLCEITFSDHSLFKLHMKAVSEGLECNSVTTHKCDFCEAVFLNPVRLEAHIRCPPGADHLKCILCERTFSSYSYWKYHMSAVSNGEDCDTLPIMHHCGFCSKEYRWLKHLNEHLQYPPGDDHFWCFSCKQTFSQLSAWKDHMENVQEGYACEQSLAVRKFYTCDTCSAEFDTPREMEYHHNNCGHQLSCHLCTKTFTTYRTWKLHKDAVSRGLSCASLECEFSCHFCSSEFESLYDLEHHLSFPPDDDHLKCSLCERKFPSLRMWNRHMNLVWEGEGCACGSIGGFGRLSSSKTHERQPPNWQKDGKLFKCTWCEESFVSYGMWKSHATAVTKNVCHSFIEADIIMCKFCLKTFASPCALHAHIRRCYSQPQCTLCKKYFPDWMRWKQHMAAISHGHECGSISITPRCLFCTKQFSSDNGLRGHLHNPSRNHVFGCYGCARSFTMYSDWDRHSSSGECKKAMTYACGFCDVTFTSVTDLQGHLDRPPGDNHFKCRACLVSFSEIASFRLHLKSHLTSSRYKCEFCMESFHRATDLRKHVLNIHLPGMIGKKKWARHHHCKLCCMTYSSDYRLRCHMKTHPITSLRCERCGMDFPSQLSFKFHSMKKHCVVVIPQVIPAQFSSKNNSQNLVTGSN